MVNLKKEDSVIKSGLTLTWDDEIEFKATQEFVDAIENLLIAEIKMMRLVHKDSPELWYCGCAKIGDLANSGHISVTYGGVDDVNWIRDRGQIFVTVPFKQN